MQTVFIDRKNSEIEIVGRRLLIHIEERRPCASLPLANIDMLVVSAGIRFSSNLLTQLTQANITAIFINPRNTEACTITCGLMHNNASRRLWQYQALSDPEIKLRYARAIVRDKLRGQRLLLKKALRTRPDCRQALVGAGNQISSLLEGLTSTPTVHSLRGCEGAAAAAYFGAYHTLFAPSLEFHNRNRRPPLDPVNAVLSLTYTLLHAEAVRTLFATGFDPLLGIYHEPSFGRESLACDMVELFRHHADLWVWRLFAEQQLRPAHFSIEKHNNSGALPCLLNKAGREIFYPLYTRKAKSWRRLMRRTARLWLVTLQNDVGKRHE